MSKNLSETYNKLSETYEILTRLTKDLRKTYKTSTCPSKNQQKNKRDLQNMPIDLQKLLLKPTVSQHSSELVG